MNAPTPLQQAIDVCGGQAALARALNVSAGLVYQWLTGARPLSADRCPDIERATGIRCELLRPDMTWTRNEGGEVTGYHVRLKPAA